MASSEIRENAKAEHGKFAINVPGAFAAACRRCQSVVVWAINAARKCDRYLIGETNVP